jgi:hypothetical protein
MSKILLLKELGPRGYPGPCLFDLYIQYSGLRLTKFQMDVVDEETFRQVWDLTCNFWAENGKRKIAALARSIE